MEVVTTGSDTSIVATFIQYLYTLNDYAVTRNKKKISGFF